MTVTEPVYDAILAELKDFEGPKQTLADTLIASGYTTPEQVATAWQPFFKGFLVGHSQGVNAALAGERTVSE